MNVTATDGTGREASGSFTIGIAPQSSEVYVDVYKIQYNGNRLNVPALIAASSATSSMRALSYCDPSWPDHYSELEADFGKSIASVDWEFSLTNSGDAAEVSVVEASIQHYTVLDTYYNPQPIAPGQTVVYSGTNNDIGVLASDKALFDLYLSYYQQGAKSVTIDYVKLKFTFNE